MIIWKSIIFLKNSYGWDFDLNAEEMIEMNNLRSEFCDEIMDLSDSYSIEEEALINQMKNIDDIYEYIVTDDKKKTNKKNKNKNKNKNKKKAKNTKEKLQEDKELEEFRITLEKDTCKLDNSTMKIKPKITMDFLETLKKFIS
jgi:hypothetical protein